MNALEELEKWCRKHYSFKFEGGPFAQPGDDAQVTLYGGGRKVQVSQIELEEWDEESATCTYYPTFSDLILEALRRWHTDRTLKKFKGVIWDEQKPPFATKEHIPGRSWWWELVAETETDALDTLKQAYVEVGREFPKSISIREGGKA